MKRMADVAKYADNELDVDVIENYSHIPPGVGIFEISGPFFFGSARQYAEWLISSGQKYEVLIIRMRHVPFVDSTGVHNLKGAIRNIQGNGTKVILSGIKSNVRKELVKGGVIALTGQERIFSNFSEALEEACGKRSVQKEPIDL